MSNRELATILKQIKNERRGGAPHDVWVKRNRDILLMQVRNTTDVSAKPGLGEYARHLFSIFFPAEGFAMAARAAGVFLLVVGTVLGGGLASAELYSGAVPGQLAYKMKIAVEKAQLALAPNDDYKTRLHTEFADRRLDEASTLAEEDAAHQALVPGVLVAFNREVAALSGGLEALKTSDPEGVAEAAKLMERKMAVYQSILRKTSSTLPPSLQQQVAVSRDLVDDVTIKAIAVIVEKHLAGSSDAPRAVVVNKFEERLKLAESKLDSAPATQDAGKTEKATKAKAAIAEAKELLKEEKYQAALSKIEEVAQLTKEVDDSGTAPETSPRPVTPDAPVTDGAPAPSDASKSETPPAPAPAP